MFTNVRRGEQLVSSKPLRFYSCYGSYFVSLFLASFALVHNSNAQVSAAYQKELDDWNTNRIAGLKADDGWLNLVGLYWLDEGKNTFGTGSQNKVVFPANSISEAAGYFERNGDVVKLVVENNTPIQVDGKTVADAVIFTPDAQKLPVVSAGSLRWTIIKRDDKIGVRLRDLKSPGPAAFKGIERFVADTAWIVHAKLVAPAVPASIAITNVIGQTTKQKSPGKLVFTINNQQYSLDALDDGDDLMVVFGDATSGVTTYPSGRFVYVNKPGPDGNTSIDFNKAHNPPCAFTDFATCPLPPSQNILPIEVTAGEKNYGDHHK